MQKKFIKFFLVALILAPFAVYAETLDDYRSPGLDSAEAQKIKNELININLSEEERQKLEDEFAGHTLNLVERAKLRELINIEVTQQQIDELQSQIIQLQNRIKELIVAEQATKLLCPRLTGDLEFRDTGNEVEELQKFLAHQRLLGVVTETGASFGERTYGAVGSFQSVYRIVSPEDEGYGRVGPRTRAAIRSLCEGPYSPVSCPNLGGGLESGDVGPRVGELQEFLIALRYMEGPETVIYYGPQTRAAVEEFQLIHSIVGRGTGPEAGFGRVGPRTRERIAKICQPQQEIRQSTYLAPQTVTVGSPNGGEVWPRRTNQQIVWNMTGGPATARLFLINVRTKRSWWISDATSTPGTNSYTWFVGGGDIDTEPVEPQAQHPIHASSTPSFSERFRIEVCLVEYVICDQTDNNFEVASPKASMRVYVGYVDGATRTFRNTDGEVSVLIIGKNLQFQQEGRGDHGSVEFHGVPFGTYIVSGYAEGFKPGAEEIHVTHGSLQYASDCNCRVRNVALDLIPDVTPPPLKVRAPLPGEVFKMGTTTYITWRADGSSTAGNVFDIELVAALPDGSKDESRKWLIAHIDRHYLEEIIANCGDACQPVPEETLKNNTFKWVVGTCAEPCLPITPGQQYYIRVIRGGGLARDATDGPIQIVGNVGTFKLTFDHDPADINTGSVRSHVYLHPGGLFVPAPPIDVSHLATWKSSNTFLVNARKDLKDRLFINAGEVGEAFITVFYQDLKVKVKVTMGGDPRNPSVTKLEIVE